MPDRDAALQSMPYLSFGLARQLRSVAKQLPDHVGVHLTGAHAVDQNIALRQLCGETLHQANHAEFGSRISGVLAATALTKQRRRQDDPSACPLGDELLRKDLCCDEGAGKIDVDYPSKICNVSVNRVLQKQNAGIRNDDVDFAKRLDRVVKRSLCLGLVRDIQCDGMSTITQGFRGLGYLVTFDIGQHDRCAILQKGPCNRQANTLRAAGDKCSLSLKLSGVAHDLLPKDPKIALFDLPSRRSSSPGDH